MLIVMKTSIAAAHLRADKTALHIDMVPGLCDHVRLSALRVVGRELHGRISTCESTSDLKEAVYATADEKECVITRYGAHMIAVLIEDAGRTYYELGATALSVLEKDLPTLTLHLSAFQQSPESRSSTE
jgi:hypothetical protein